MSVFWVSGRLQQNLCLVCIEISVSNHEYLQYEMFNYALCCKYNNTRRIKKVLNYTKWIRYHILQDKNILSVRYCNNRKQYFLYFNIFVPTFCRPQNASPFIYFSCKNPSHRLFDTLQKLGHNRRPKYKGQFILRSHAASRKGRDENHDKYNVCMIQLALASHGSRCLCGHAQLRCLH